MSCEECSVRAFGREAYPYRWKDTCVMIIACEKHATEVIEALNAIQKLQERRN